MATELLRAVKGKLAIGRAPDNDHVIDHPMVSKHHRPLNSRRGRLHPRRSRLGQRHVLNGIAS